MNIGTIVHYENLYANIFDNWDEMDNFFEKCQISKLTKEKRKKYNSLLVVKEIKSMIQTLHTKKTIPG